MCKPEDTFPSASCRGNGVHTGAQLSLFLGTVQRAAHQMAHIAREIEVSQPTTTAITPPPREGEEENVVVVVDHTSHTKLLPPPAVTAGDDSAVEGKHETSEPDKGDQDKSSIGQRAKKSKRRRSAANHKNHHHSDNNDHENDPKRSRVEHDYHDYANALPEDLPDAEVEKKSRGGISSPFPIVLHSMLERADTQGYTGIVSWQPHGRAFHVHDQTRFVTEIMPLYFRQTRFSSFQRQLSLYGFLRLTRKGPDHGAYYHQLFLRGKPILCHKMQRTRVKGYWVRQSSSPETEPDFTHMLPPMGPSSESANMWVGTNVAMIPPPPPLATTNSDGPTTSALFPPPAQGSLWDLMQLSSSSPGINNKHGGGGGGGVPAGFDNLNSFMTRVSFKNNHMKLPPMPPLSGSCMVDLNYALPFPVDYNNTNRNNNVAVPPFRPLKLPPMLSLKTAPTAAPLEAEFPRAPPGSPASGAAEVRGGDAGNRQQQQPHTLAEIANEFSAAERQDLAAFLSDVDLDSGDEKDAAYKNEEELGRILHAKKKAKNFSSV